MKQAINNQSKINIIIDELHAISQKLIFAVPQKCQSSARAKRPKASLS